MSEQGDDTWLVTGEFPVKAFLSAARRSRDFWYASQLASHTILTLAEHLERECGATLFFPTSSVVAKFPQRDVAASNKLLFRFVGDPTTLPTVLRQWASAYWRKQGDLLWGTLPTLSDRLHREMWDIQVDTLFTLTIAWVPDVPDARASALRALERRLQAQKRSRLFGPSPIVPWWSGGRDKSSLDGRQESVIDDRRSLSPELRRQSGLGTGEVLDAPGFMKRIGGRDQRFTALSRIAQHYWWKGIEVDNALASAVMSLREAHDALVPSGLVSRAKGNEGLYQYFPYDAQLLYRARIDVLARAARSDESLGHALVRTDGRPGSYLDEIKAAVDTLVAKYGEPPTSVALLLFDGDGIGAWLQRQAHRLDAASNTLSGFAVGVSPLTRAYGGQCVYAAGDEGFIIAPAVSAVPLACRLNAMFVKQTNGATLGVGLCIGHVLEPMNALMARVREALAEAKVHPGRLTVSLKPRGGVDARMTSPFANRPDERLGHWIAHYRDGTLPMGAPYGLARWGQSVGRDNGVLMRSATRKTEVLSPLLHRTLARTGMSEGVAKVLHDAIFLDDVFLSTTLTRVIDELLIARHLSRFDPVIHAQES